MSVLIKGIDMPKNCLDCEIFGLCSLKDRLEHIKDRNPDCPLIEIPTPHGRLIDADIMQREAYQKNFDGIISDMALFNLNYYLEEKAQTILEAEERHV